MTISARRWIKLGARKNKVRKNGDFHARGTQPYWYNPPIRPPLGMPWHTQTHVNFRGAPCEGLPRMPPWVCPVFRITRPSDRHDCLLTDGVFGDPLGPDGPD